MPDSAVWLPIVALVMGYGAKALEDWFQSNRTVAREREARAEARRDKRTERRRELQRETLLSSKI